MSALITTRSVSAFEESQNTKLTTSVTTQAFESLRFNPSRNAPAKVESLNRSRIPAEVGAVVSRLTAKVGKIVEAGELLAELDCRDFELNFQVQSAQLEQLKIQQEFEQREVKRGEKLLKRKNLGEAELDRRKTILQTTQAQALAQQASVNRALLEKSRCKILAPFAGVVISRLASEGEMIEKGAPVIELVQTDELEVSANIALSDEVSFVGANQYYLEANSQNYPVKVRQLTAAVVDSARSREARLVFLDKSTLPGVIGRLVWRSPTPHLPAHLLQKRGEQFGVFISNDSNAHFIAIPEAQEGRPIPILDESQWSGAQLIIDGRHGLQDKQKISIKK
ncbi:efflux RND transporter periplasmic adaptor subunit [Aliikangiella coralliicola]|uniref:efflux RND transporter periplasmic adaptor subunit n=1 Tax=Aliikangiella coralliicola TaxID=2592383 RepID=UPI00143D034F|nr:efflux RND transporter periplasmic adaptor subunit [Aliikangiella coralliicola]